MVIARVPQLPSRIRAAGSVSCRHFAGAAGLRWPAGNDLAGHCPASLRPES